MKLKIEFKNIHSTRDYFDKVYNMKGNDCTEVTILVEKYNTLKDYLHNVYKSFYDKNVIFYYDITNHNEGYISWCNEKGLFCSAKISDITPQIIGFREIPIEKLKAPKRTTLGEAKQSIGVDIFINYD